MIISFSMGSLRKNVFWSKYIHIQSVVQTNCRGQYAQTPVKQQEEASETSRYAARQPGSTVYYAERSHIANERSDGNKYCRNITL